MKTDSLKKFLIPHLLSLLGPILIWIYLYIYRVEPAEINLFEHPYLIPTGMGFILGMVFGYLICLFKWMSLRKRAQSEPPDET